MNVVKNIDKAILRQKNWLSINGKSFGGGGKGMRIAFNEKELKENFSSAMNEQNQALVMKVCEKFIEFPTYLNQILGDQFVILFIWVKKCSIQRRHQEVIEGNKVLLVMKP